MFIYISRPNFYDNPSDSEDSSSLGKTGPALHGGPFQISKQLSKPNNKKIVKRKKPQNFSSDDCGSDSDGKLVISRPIKKNPR